MTNSELFGLLFRQIISDDYTNAVVTQHLREEFEATGYVKLPNFFTEATRNLISRQLRSVETISLRRNFVMPGYETPRRLSVAGGGRILEECFPLAMVYANYSLWSVLSAITGKPLYPVAHPEEFIVANFLLSEDDTHGWHLDDPQFALIMISSAPPQGEGGLLEFVPGWREFCARHGLDPVSDVEQAIHCANASGVVRQIHHAAGECYLLNAAENLHRVTPIVGRDTRSALNMAFDDRQSRHFGDTATLLYGEEVHV
ncbi:HalD/BesD family halogenase [Burkholderia glumae]|uniref:HalD/BesD family halogenase n=1 Tax=Burkholderia glumae TaxID=337 RepID=UPI0011D26B74|nr:hypothetical protein [Burkholderia glumae]MCM2543924.1 hypothetical protein [Burkholderia glumae]